MSESTLPNHCEEALKEIAGKIGIKHYEIKVNKGSTKGDNFLSVVYSITLHSNEEVPKPDLKLVLKMAPGGTCRASAAINLTFSREAFAYNHVLKALNKLQNETGVERPMQYNFIQCFFASDENLKEFLVMEDLKDQGFQMLNRQDSVNIEIAKLVLEALAKLHSVSFALERKNPELFHRLTSNIPDIIDLKGAEVFENPRKAAINLASKVIHDPELKKNFQKILDGGFTMFANSVKRQSISTICHGDSWINNTLIKYNENGKPTEVRLFDFQIMRYAPPASDVLYFLITSTDGKLRSDHFYELIDFYYESLSQSLQVYSYRVEDVLPKEELFKQLKAVSPYAISIGVMVANLLNTTPEDSMDTNDIMSTKKWDLPKGASYDKFAKRVNDIIKDCTEYGYFD